MSFGFYRGGSASFIPKRNDLRLPDLQSGRDKFIAYFEINASVLTLLFHFFYFLLAY
jgi:hypothetical protein